MKIFKSTKWTQLALLIAGLLTSVATSGCMPFAGFQSTVGGQTLPSAYYLRDDVQFFPAGEEFLLPNQVRALEEYKANRLSIENNLDN